MSLLKPIYRLELRSPRSDQYGTLKNTAETGILMPPAGGLHRDWFRIATEQIGYGLEFEGETTSWCKRSIVNSWPTTALSAECWVRVDNTHRDFGLFSYAVSGSDNQFLMFVYGDRNTGFCDFYIKQTAVAVSISSGNLLDGKWHHVACTWTNSGGTFFIYIDGAQVATGTVQNAASITGGGSFYIGQEQDAVDGGLDPQQALRGGVDEVKIYSRVLSAQEVVERFHGIVSNDANKILHWGFDEGYGASTVDKSGTGNDGAIRDARWNPETPVTYKPYLGLIRGRRGRLDPLSKQIDAGQLTISSIDKELPGGTQLQRWYTQFVGNSVRRNALLGVKAVIDESLDGGVTFGDGSVIPGNGSAFFTGRVQTNSLDNAVWFSMNIRDQSPDLECDVFVGAPHSSITYAHIPSLFPLGLRTAYSNFTLQPQLRGKIKQKSTDGRTGVILLNQNSLGRRDNVFTIQAWRMGHHRGGMGVTWGQAGVDLYGYNGVADADVDRSVGAHITVVSGGAIGQMSVIWLEPQIPVSLQEEMGPLGLYRIWLRELAPTDPNYIAMPAINADLDFDVVGNIPLDQGMPLYVNDTHIAVFIRDMLDGKFSILNSDGTTVRVFPYDTTVMTNMINDPTLPTIRFPLFKRENRKEVIQKLCKAHNLGYRFNGKGEFVLIDMRVPDTLGSPPQLVDDDLVTGSIPSWGQNLGAALTSVEYTYYNEDQHSVEKARRDAPIVEVLLVPASPGSTNPWRPPNPAIYLKLPDAVGSISKSLDCKFRTIYNNFDYGDRDTKIDVQGFRFATPESNAIGPTAKDEIEAKLEIMANHLVFPFISGASEMQCRCRRTPNALSCQTGDWRLITFSVLPDMSTNQRGGTRLMRCVERSEEAELINLNFLDAGPYTFCASPTLGTVVQDATVTRHAINIPVTSAGGIPVALDYAITDTSVVVRPADNSSLWHRWGMIFTDRTVVINQLPSNSRIWIRGRSEYLLLVGALGAGSSFQTQLPSPWAYPSGSGRADTAAISPPTGFSVTNILATTAQMNWTVGDINYAIEILLDQATSGSWVPVAIDTVMPGSSVYFLEGLTQNAIHTAGVRHRDSWGGVSTIANQQFTTGNSTPVCPDMRGLSVLAG